MEHQEPASVDLTATGGRTHAERVATFLRFACWDEHEHGKGDHLMYDRAAGRLLGLHPEIARDSIYTAVVAGDLQEVERILAARPEAALAPGGPRGWTPLLYLCYARFTHRPTIDNAVAIARALLDRGANPNDFYMAGSAKYTALVGVAGDGEQDSPRQPQAPALFQLLLERGAGPFDIQVLYNTHFRGEVLWWLELIYAHTMKTGRTAEWQDPEWSMLDMGGYGSGARFLLATALDKHDLQLAEWLLEHGANPDAPAARDPRFANRSIYAEAMARGLSDLADLLLRHGATPTAPVLDDTEQFVSACLRLNRADALAHLERHPEFLRSHQVLFAAASHDLPDAVSFALDLGVPVDVGDARRQRALHMAAGANALRAATRLIERGADSDARETTHNATPLGYAVHYWHEPMIALLVPYSRDVWNLAFTGHVDRLREVLRAEPGHAKSITKDGYTPLWWLPDDEEKALEVVELFLEYGVDPAAASKEGTTAVGWALKRGMRHVAARCRGRRNQIREEKGDQE